MLRNWTKRKNWFVFVSWYHLY